jgi:ATP-dependent exoDNAse (exonuclease V) alpha subunit
MIDRSLVYTAVTRAQVEVVLLTNSEELGTHIARRKAADRRLVGLPERLLAAGLRPAAVSLP